MNLEQAMARIAELEQANKADRVHWHDEWDKTNSTAHNLLVDELIPMLNTIVAILNKNRPELMGHAQNYADRALAKATEKADVFKKKRSSSVPR